MTRLTLSVLLALFFTGCDRDPTLRCDPAPATLVSELMFRVVDKTTGEDILIPGMLHPDSVSATQNCNSASGVVKVEEGYSSMKNGNFIEVDSTRVVHAFSFAGLKTRYHNEGAECEVFYIHWNATDTDTLRFVEQGDGCKVARVSTLTFNGEVILWTEHAFKYRSESRLEGVYILKK